MQCQQKINKEEEKNPGTGSEAKIITYFVFFRHSDSGQTSPVNTGGLFGPEQRRDDVR